MNIIVTYLVTAGIFLSIDAIWLSKVAVNFYKNELGDRMADPVNLGVALAFYLVYAAGVVYFAVKPGLDAGSASLALMNGAILGFLAYATYDLTNYATLKDWPLKMTLVDMAWGTVLTGSVAFLSCWVIQNWLQ